MKAFALANQQGQKIYTITKDNIAEVLPKIQASYLAKGDIQSSVYAGKTVTVHEREVSVPGWRGTGYMVIDPVSGNRAYMISGGGNGGFFKNLGTKLQFWVGMIQGWAKNHPYIAKALGGTIGLIVGTLIKVITLINSCKSTGGIIAIVGMFLVWNMIFLIMSFALIAIAAPLAVTFLIAGIEWYLENQFLEHLHTIYCYIKRKKQSRGYIYA